MVEFSSSYILHIYIYIYIYIYIHTFFKEKLKLGHIRIINLFPSC